MTNVTSSIKRTRHACLAALLSLLMPGVGHAYCGQLTRGLAFGLLYGVAIPAVLGLLAYFGPASTVQFGFLMIFASLGVVVAAAADAYRLAQRTRSNYEPRNSLELCPSGCPGIPLLRAGRQPELLARQPPFRVHPLRCHRGASRLYLLACRHLDAVRSATLTHQCSAQMYPAMQKY